MRNEEASADRNLFKTMFKELSRNRAVPVSALHPPRSRSFMPTGRCHCVRSPARKSMKDEVKKEEEENENEERRMYCG